MIIEQIRKQLEKLVDVLEVRELMPEQSVFRELALIKVNAEPKLRSEIAGIVEIFRAGIVDVGRASLTIEITGDQGKIAAFLELMQPYGVIEIVTTGLTGLDRGETVLKPAN
jgi:acetolactate synthase-1/3 small subunit